MEARPSNDQPLLETLALRVCPIPHRTTKWQRDVRNLTTGDLVIVVDENSPRGRWPLGRVTRVLPGDDGRIRAAEVRTKSGTYVRPTVKLCFLKELPKPSE